MFSAPAHTLEKRGGGNGQQLAATLEEALNCHMGASMESPPVQQQRWAQAGIRASFRGVGLLRQFSLAWSQPHAVQFCDM